MAQQTPLSSQPLPQEAYHYANLYNLGQPETIYRVDYRSSRFVGIVSLVGIALFIFVLLVDKTATTFDIIASLFWICFFLAAVVYYLLVYPLRFHTWRIYSCAQGFVFLQGQQAIPYRWDQIVAIWQRIPRAYYDGVYGRTLSDCSVQRTDGVQVAITRIFRSSSELTRRIRNEVSNRLMPQAQATFDAGQTLSIGPFGLSREGLTTPNGTFPWSEIQVSANRARVLIQRRSQQEVVFSCSVQTVPNLAFFLGAAQALVRGPGG